MDGHGFNSDTSTQNFAKNSNFFCQKMEVLVKTKNHCAKNTKI